MSHLPHLIAHESYPGHHTEHCRKEAGLVASGQAEQTLFLVNTPQCLMAEGLADLALDAIVGPGWGKWAQDIYADLGLSVRRRTRGTTARRVGGPAVGAAGRGASPARPWPRRRRGRRIPRALVAVESANVPGRRCDSCRLRCGVRTSVRMSRDTGCSAGGSTGHLPERTVPSGSVGCSTSLSCPAACGDLRLDRGPPSGGVDGVRRLEYVSCRPSLGEFSMTAVPGNDMNTAALADLDPEVAEAMAG